MIAPTSMVKDDGPPSVITVSDDRRITAIEVRGWFKKKPPNDAQCSEIADRLTKMRWPSDRPRVPLPDDAREWYWRARMLQLNVPQIQKPDSVGAGEVGFRAAQGTQRYYREIRRAG